MDLFSLVQTKMSWRTLLIVWYSRRSLGISGGQLQLQGRGGAVGAGGGGAGGGGVGGIGSSAGGVPRGEGAARDLLLPHAYLKGVCVFGGMGV